MLNVLLIIMTVILPLGGCSTSALKEVANLIHPPKDRCNHEPHVDIAPDEDDDDNKPAPQPKKKAKKLSKRERRAAKKTQDAPPSYEDSCKDNSQIVIYTQK